MIFLTSISPKHTLENRQQLAVKSWLVHGDVISFNHPSEIEILKTQGYDERIKFMPTNRTQKAFFGRHYVCINTLTDYVVENKIDNACMINSDISITENKSTIEKCKEQIKNGFVYLHRWDMDGDNKKASHIYMDGIDAFFFNHTLAETLPQTMYCLGQTYFDIWLPYHFLVIYNMPIISIRTEPIIYHQRHHVQYDQGMWITMGKYTAFLTGKDHLRPEGVSSSIYTTLRKHTTYL